MPRPLILELAVDSVNDALLAAEAGADRLELCSDLANHGLTPDPALVRAVVSAVQIPIMAMVRPRPGTFHCSPADLESLERDARDMLDAGAHAIVFGPLAPDYTVDRAAVARLVTLARDKQTVFHRAIDLTPDPLAAADTLALLGVTRILCAGQLPAAAAKAMNLNHPDLARPSTEPALASGSPDSDCDPERFARLCALIDHAGPDIEILSCGGVRVSNVSALLRATGATQIHSSCRVAGAFNAAEAAGLRAAIDTLQPRFLL